MYGYDVCGTVGGTNGPVCTVGCRKCARVHPLYVDTGVSGVFVVESFVKVPWMTHSPLWGGHTPRDYRGGVVPVVTLDVGPRVDASTCVRGLCVYTACACVWVVVKSESRTSPNLPLRDPFFSPRLPLPSIFPTLPHLSP